MKIGLGGKAKHSNLGAESLSRQGAGAPEGAVIAATSQVRFWNCLFAIRWDDMAPNT